jgi:hypothetical protein
LGDTAPIGAISRQVCPGLKKELLKKLEAAEEEKAEVETLLKEATLARARVRCESRCILAQAGAVQ